MLVIFWILSRFKNLFSQDLKHIWQTKCPWKYTWVGLSLGVSIRYPCHLKKITLHWKIYIITEKKNTFASPQKSVIPTLWNSETKYNLAIICYKKCQFLASRPPLIPFWCFQFDLWLPPLPILLQSYDAFPRRPSLAQ